MPISFVYSCLIVPSLLLVFDPLISQPRLHFKSLIYVFTKCLADSSKAAGHTLYQQLPVNQTSDAEIASTSFCNNAGIGNFAARHNISEDNELDVSTGSGIINSGDTSLDNFGTSSAAPFLMGALSPHHLERSQAEKLGPHGVEVLYDDFSGTQRLELPNTTEQNHGRISAAYGSEVKDVNDGVIKPDHKAAFSSLSLDSVPGRCLRRQQSMHCSCIIFNRRECNGCENASSSELFNLTNVEPASGTKRCQCSLISVGSGTIPSQEMIHYAEGGDKCFASHRNSMQTSL